MKFPMGFVARTGTPAGRNRSREARGMMKQSRSKVAREIGSLRGGLFPETTRGVYAPDARLPLKETYERHTIRYN